MTQEAGRAGQPAAQGNRAAILAMLGAMATFSLGDAIMKFATSRLPVGEVVVIRSAFSLVLILVTLRIIGETLTRRGLAHPAFLLRALLESLVVVSFVSLLGKLGLGDITTLSQMTPLMMTALAAIVLKEHVGWRRWSATAVGFIGVLFVARPGQNGIDPWALAAVGVAALVAVRDLVTRYLPRDLTTGVVTLGTALASGAGGLALGLFETWTRPTAGDIGLAAMAAVMTTAGNMFIVQAFRHAEVSAVSPFRYAVIPIALFYGWIGFDERPDGHALIGIGLIVASGLYTLHRDRVRASERKAAPSRP